MYRQPVPPAKPEPASYDPSASGPGPVASKPDVVDELQAEVAVWPENAPEMRPLLRLPFAQRAEAMERFADVQSAIQAGDMPKKGDTVGAEHAARMYRVLAKMDHFLTTVAADIPAYKAWVDDASDEEFGNLFSAYMAKFSPGEASSSTS